MCYQCEKEQNLKILKGLLVFFYVYNCEPCRLCQTKFVSKTNITKLCKRCRKEQKKLKTLHLKTKQNKRETIQDIRNSMYNTIRYHKKYGNKDKYIRLFSCSYNQFKNHIESLFYNHPITGEVMTWENHGYYGWHIDHIIPISHFYEHKELGPLKGCCHYTNLQPLWAEQNFTKGTNLGFDINKELE
jgi:hypothetical protein